MRKYFENCNVLYNANGEVQVIYTVKSLLSSKRVMVSCTIEFQINNVSK